MLSPTDSPSGRTRILQVHPTRLCNLRCRHCYSSSAPELSESLPIDLLLSAVTDAAAAGYTVLGISGGEPFLYRHLNQLTTQARQLGLTTTVTTNGTTLNAERLAELKPSLDLLAISLDGIPESHDRMRGVGSFQKMQRNLSKVRQANFRFGFIFTLTQFNLHEIDWALRFAVSEGASLFQIHPLELVGRAIQQLPAARPDATEEAFTVLELMRLREEFGDRIAFQLDVASSAALQDSPDCAFAGNSLNLSELIANTILSDLVAPLVIEPDGVVVPLRYGFGRTHALGSLYEAPLAALAAEWKREKYRSFRSVCGEVFGQMTSVEAAPFDNWYERVADASNRYPEQPTVDHRSRI